MKINDQVIVILTDHGKEILDGYRTNFERLMEYKIESDYLHYDRNGKYEDSLWHIMYIFGAEMYNGSKQVFKDNEIYLD